MKSDGETVLSMKRCTSPPSRGAWIEIKCLKLEKPCCDSRPPRGGRGLKYVGRVVAVEGSTVAPLAGGVD